MTLRGAWHKVRDDATLRFMFIAAIFYGLSTFEGSFLAIRPVNSLSHYTDWTVAHVHAGALGWVALITFGSLYTLVPSLWHREKMYSAALVEVHFWLALAGTFIYIFAMWNSGIIQGLMWRTYTDDDTLAYSFVDTLVAMYPYYIARAFGGLLFLLGAIVGAYNIWMTARHAPQVVAGRAEDRPLSSPPQAGSAEPAE
jgi:cytochrome c oxidase cbb3-type subunit 1